MTGATGMVGRHRELETLSSLVLDPDGPSATLIHGGAGQGKSTLWSWVVDQARSRGWTVQAARSTVVEADLPWVGIADLVATADPSAYAALPGPQRRALDTVALRDPVEHRATSGSVEVQPVDARVVGTALHSVLTIGRTTPAVLMALDDMAHLDPASADAVRFALRRLAPTDAVHVVATARGDDSALLDEVPGGASRLAVPGLSVGSLYQLLHERLGLVLSRPTLVRVHDASMGNPLHALELGRALQRRELPPAAGLPLPVPPTLQLLVKERLAALSPEVRQFTAAVAASWRTRAAEADQITLRCALVDEVVVVRDDEVRLVHPLLGSAAYDELSDDDRRRLHSRLAMISSDPIDRGRHLALADGPPGIVLAALDAATDEASLRGAPAAAAELCRMSLDRTPAHDSSELARRSRLADLPFRAGDAHGAVAIQAAVVADQPLGPARARQRLRLAELVVEIDNFNRAVPELAKAIEEAAGDPLLAAEAHLTWAAVSYDDLRAAVAHADAAVELIETVPDPDPAILAGAITQLASSRFRAGLGLDREAFERAIDLEARRPSRRLSDRADAGYAALLKYADDMTAAAPRLAALRAEANETGDVSSLLYVLSHLAQLELWRGDLANARQVVDEHVALAESTGMFAQRARARYLLADVMIHEGRTAQAVSLVTEDLANARERDELWDQQRLLALLGSAAASVGDHAAAAGPLRQWWSILLQVGLAEPGYARHHLDLVEALVATGGLDEADAVLDVLDGQVKVTGRASGRMAAHAGRALVRSARLDTTGAEACVVAALAAAEATPLRLARARTLLVAGEIRRRAKAKSAARAALQEALAEFTAMGAEPWRVRTAAGLARINIRPHAPSELTETERQVAALAATGLTNRQVADRLFLATKTVEANLARAYRKLGISSRAELGAVMGSSPAG